MRWFSGVKLHFFLQIPRTCLRFMRFLYVFAVLSPMLVPLEPLIAFRILANFEGIFWICHANKLLLHVES